MLQENNSDTAQSMQILQFMFAGMLAFDLLDRLTGNWTVMNAKVSERSERA